MERVAGCRACRRHHRLHRAGARRCGARACQELHGLPRRRQVADRSLLQGRGHQVRQGSRCGSQARQEGARRRRRRLGADPDARQSAGLRRGSHSTRQLGARPEVAFRVSVRACNRDATAPSSSFPVRQSLRLFAPTACIAPACASHPQAGAACARGARMLAPRPRRVRAACPAETSSGPAATQGLPRSRYIASQGRDNMNGAATASCARTVQRIARSAPSRAKPAARPNPGFPPWLVLPRKILPGFFLRSASAPD